jgi:hypothetical protein
VVGFRAQARAEQSRKESLERRRAALSSLGNSAAMQDNRSAVEREKQAWREDKARLREEMAHMERGVRLAEVRNRRLELDKEHLQRKMIELMVDKRRLQQRVEEMEERTSREEIRRHCVVCMDHTRSHVLMPCRHYIVCQYCANSIRSATTGTLVSIVGSLSHSWDRVAYATCAHQGVPRVPVADHGEVAGLRRLSRCIIEEPPAASPPLRPPQEKLQVFDV